MEKDKAIKIWENTWKAETHITDFAKKRISSAKSAKLTPIKIDVVDFYGYFQGGYGRYETFLDSCPCGDFIRYKLPCKHIYRLAMELGLINNTDVKSNANAIVTPKNERATLDEIVDLVETLSKSAQQHLLCIAAGVSSTSPTYRIKLDENVSELINSHHFTTFLQKNNAQGTFWCIISLLKKHTKESDLVRQTYYTTKTI